MSGFERIAAGLVGVAFGLNVLDEKKPVWARIAYGAVAFDLVSNAFKSTPHPLLGDPSARLSDAGEKVRSTFKPTKFVEKRVKSIDERVSYVHQQMIQGTRDPKVYTLAREVLKKRCGDDWCVPAKDAKAEATALFDEVRKRVRYTWDPTDYDAFQTPAKTLELATGDCFVKGTLVLRDDHTLVPIESLRVGDRIWGHNDWSAVTKTWEKGILPTSLVRLNNGSSMRLTGNHKVWVYQCRKAHKGTKRFNCACGLDQRDLVRIPVSKLRPGMVLTQPKKVAYGTEDFDAKRAYVEGLYLSDGWSDSYRFSISGLDGHPKEAQKCEVEDICKILGLTTRMAKKYIAVNDKPWAQRMNSMGKKAPQKHALSVGLNEEAARELLRGILADSGKNSHGAGVTFTTTSRSLWLQTRVLLKMAGISASERYIVEHGGLGTNPIWRLGVRGPRIDGKAEKLLRVKEVIADGAELPCFDIETSDHFVWLPEADWTTSQCDDFSSLLGAMLRSIGHQVRSRIVQMKGSPQPWDHIYLMVKVGNAWMPLDPTVAKPAGWEVPANLIARKQDFDVVESGSRPQLDK